ncbi:helix-turn-helix transcriptional regulator [Bacteriovorax sp. BSW11_IV]|uniref:helix-turn-helix transcriptional regulator n=1 Tax=Bacteriovorax sp. BSW11_IV TaxID=1353529 RepID=UPI00054E5710|nr:YafY family protein [Bacteriovorax sp. BSW11_IV]
MIRSDRLLELLQILRTNRYPISGEKLAQKLNISLRTLYRDIALLQNKGAEIIGEPGVGYILRPGFFIPPLMFNQDELDAIVLGLQWVQQYGDAPLSKASQNVFSKISEGLPKNTIKEMNRLTLRVGAPATKEHQEEDLDQLRNAIRMRKKLEIKYRSKVFHIFPITIGYFSDKRILVGWDNDKEVFHHFDTKKVILVKTLEQMLLKSQDSLFDQWLKTQKT